MQHWSEPLRVDNQLRNANLQRGSDEKRPDCSATRNSRSVVAEFEPAKLLLKSTTVTGLNRIRVLDITYIQLRHENIYLAVILDLSSRKCISWNLGRSLSDQLAKCISEGIEE